MSESFFNGKKVLVTGGTGSVGSEIVKRLLAADPEVVRIYSRDESKQFDMQHELYAYKNVRFLLGDVRDRDRLERAMEDVDCVFHAAALKHVPACEYNPFEAVKTNVIGTQNLVEAALSARVGRVVSISTDKAANPDNTMGASKLLGEKIVSAGNHFKGNKPTVFASVRFGNVLNSRGSFLPLFKKQIERGGPVTVTDPGMTRFVITMDQAMHLVFKAMEIMEGGEVFALKMPVVRLGDMVEVIVENVAPRYGRKPSEVARQMIGLRPGETMYEDLVTSEEAHRLMETDEMYVILPPMQFRRTDCVYPGGRSAGVPCYRSDWEEPIGKGEIKDLLDGIGYFG